MHTGRLFGKRGNNQYSSLRSDVSWKTSEEENCHPSTWQCEASHCTVELANNSKERLGTALPSTLQSGFDPPPPLRLPLVRALEGSPERSPVRDWRGSPGSREKLIGRSWNDSYRRDIFKIQHHWQKCIDRDGDFIEKVTNDAWILLI
jgi:hypothetical protein